MKAKQTTRTCVQCHREISNCIEAEKAGKEVILAYICFYPDCPNYGLLAVPEELMPKLEKIKKGGSSIGF